MLTEDSIWTVYHGRERPGFVVYGYWRESPPLPAEPLFPKSLWSEVEIVRHQLRGEGWTVLLWDVAVNRWPSQDEWPRAIRKTLEQLIDSGAQVAWCAPEGHFVEPPLLFAPEHMGDSVFAVYSDRGFQLAAQLGQNFETISDAEMRLIRKCLKMPNEQ